MRALLSNAIGTAARLESNKERYSKGFTQISVINCCKSQKDCHDTGNHKAFGKFMGE